MATHFKVIVAVLVVGAGFALFSIFGAPFMPASLLQENTAVEALVVNSVKKSIVALHSVAPYGMRSGLILDKSGLVVTLSTTIQRKSTISGYFQGEQVSLKNLHSGNDSLALLRLVFSDDLPVVEFADEGKITVGQKVFLVAATTPNQAEWIVSEGIVSQVNSEIVATDIVATYERASSPMFNTAGELVGITYIDVNGRISAVPINKVLGLKNF